MFPARVLDVKANRSELYKSGNPLFLHSRIAKTKEVAIMLGLPGGYRNNNGNYNNIGNNGNWWSASENNTNNAWNRNLNYNDANVNRNNNNKQNGFSIRCLRDLLETQPRYF